MKSKNVLTASVAALSVAAGTSIASAATILVQYDFEDGTLAPTTEGTGFNGSNLSQTGFTKGTLATNGTGDNTNDPFVSASGAPIDSASLITGNPPSYGSFNFTLTNTTATPYDIDSSEFKLGQSGMTPGAAYTVTSSLTGASVLASSSAGFAGVGGDTATFTLVTADVSDSAFDGITAANVTFNVNFTGNGSDQTGRLFIDKIDVQGAIPEPASLALLGLGGLMLLPRRRPA